jgi:phage shock protein A
MSYFTRLTDIVTFNLSDLLDEESDPQAAISQVISEIERGVASAERSMTTASSSQQRLRGELAGYRERIVYWDEQARSWLKKRDERQARLSLICKHEVEDLVGGLTQQLDAASATCDHMTTTYRALQARLAEAKRRSEGLERGATPAESETAVPADSAGVDGDAERRIEDELNRLRAELGGEAE